MYSVHCLIWQLILSTILIERIEGGELFMRKRIRKWIAFLMAITMAAGMTTGVYGYETELYSYHYDEYDYHEEYIKVTELEDQEMVYFAVGNMSPWAWKTDAADNMMKPVEGKNGIYAIELTFPAYSKDSKWMSRVAILGAYCDDFSGIDTLGTWSRILVGEPNYIPDSSQTCLSNIRVCPNQELTATVYLDQRTGVVYMEDKNGNEVDYYLSWVGNDDDEVYMTIEEYANMNFNDYYEGLSSDDRRMDLDRIEENTDLTLSLFDGTYLQMKQELKEYIHNEEEETTKPEEETTKPEEETTEPEDETTEPEVPTEDKTITFHFENAKNWETVGGWIFQGVAFDRNVTDAYVKVTKSDGTIKNLWPGAKCIDEGNGWVTVDATFSKTVAKDGAVLIFNNFVGDSVANFLEDPEDIEAIKASGIATKDTVDNEQTQNITLNKRNVFKDGAIPSEVWISYDGRSVTVSATCPDNYQEKEPETIEPTTEEPETTEPSTEEPTTEAEGETKTIISEDTNISITYQDNDSHENVSVSSKIIEENEEEYNEVAEKIAEYTSRGDGIVRYSVFEIHLVDDDNHLFVLNAKVTVCIPVPEGYDGTLCKVYRVEEDGKFTDMNGVFENGVLRFETEHFSKYIVTDCEIDISDEESEVIIPGDVNGDGLLDIKDSALIKRHLAGWEVKIDEDAADVNGDGIVDVKDSALVKRSLAGWDVVLGKQ